MRKYKVFLASSAELDKDKEQVELFIARKNKNYHNRRIFLELSTWRDFISAMTKEHSQEKYNAYIRDCDITIFLFHTRMGRYTKEEFDEARKAFLSSNRKNKNPLIYTFFREGGNKVSPEIEEMKSYVDGLEHFYDTYSSNEDLFVKIDQQLEKLENIDVIKPEPIDIGKIVKYAVYYFLLPLLVLGGGLTSYYYYQPTDMTVKVNEVRGIPHLPFTKGSVTLQYGDKTETLKITDEVIFKQIPSKYKRSDLQLKFEAEQFKSIDTIVNVSDLIQLSIERDGSLGLMQGNVMDEDGNALKDVKVVVRDLSTETNEIGNFSIRIPTEKQDTAQRIQFIKDGYQKKDSRTVVIADEMMRIILVK